MRDEEHQPSESSRVWLPTFNDARETSRADSITINRPWQSFYSLLTNLLNYSPFWRGVQRTKKVRQTGKAFDDILTGHHDASQYRTSETRKKTEEQDFRSHRWTKWGIIHPRHWTKVIIHSCLLPMNLKDIDHAIFLHLCNRETFLFHFDQRYEALSKETFQVQETISG